MLFTFNAVKDLSEIFGLTFFFWIFWEKSELLWLLDNADLNFDKLWQGPISNEARWVAAF